MKNYLTLTPKSERVLPREMQHDLGKEWYDKPVFLGRGKELAAVSDHGAPFGAKIGEVALFEGTVNVQVQRFA